MKNMRLPSRVADGETNSGPGSGVAVDEPVTFIEDTCYSFHDGRPTVPGIVPGAGGTSGKSRILRLSRK